MSILKRLQFGIPKCTDKVKAVLLLGAQQSGSRGGDQAKRVSQLCDTSSPQEFFHMASRSLLASPQQSMPLLLSQRLAANKRKVMLYNSPYEAGPSEFFFMVSGLNLQTKYASRGPSLCCKYLFDQRQMRSNTSFLFNCPAIIMPSENPSVRAS